MIDNGRCDKELIWNASNCKCECDKLCHVREYLDYRNCKCRKRLTNKLVEECGENNYRNEIIYTGNLDGYEKICNSCTVYIVTLYY